MIGNRIKLLREEFNLKQEDLAKKIDVSPSAIGMYERDLREPNDELTLKLAEFFGVTTDYLLGKSNKRYKEDLGYVQMLYTEVLNQYKEEFSELKLNASEQSIYNYIVSDFSLDKFNNKIDEQKIYDYIDSTYLKNKKDVSRLSKDKIIKKVLLFIAYTEDVNDFSKKLTNRKYYMCPVYGQISAGQPNWAEENIEGRIPIDPNLMNIVDPEDCFFLRVNGESMNKIIKNGAFALIHKQDYVDNGEIAVVLVNGDNATLKRFSKQGDIIVLTPESNDDSFKQQIYTKDTPIRVIGKYVGKMEINK